MNSIIAKEIRILELQIWIPLSVGAFNAWSEWLITPNFKYFSLSRRLVNVSSDNKYIEGIYSKETLKTLMQAF